MKSIRIASLILTVVATVLLTIRAAIHEPASYAAGVFCLGATGCLAIWQLLVIGENK